MSIRLVIIFFSFFVSFAANAKLNTFNIQTSNNNLSVVIGMDYKHEIFAWVDPERDELVIDINSDVDAAKIKLPNKYETKGTAKVEKIVKGHSYIKIPLNGFYKIVGNKSLLNNKTYSATFNLTKTTKAVYKNQISNVTVVRDYYKTNSNAKAADKNNLALASGKTKPVADSKKEPLTVEDILNSVSSRFKDKDSTNLIVEQVLSEANKKTTTVVALNANEALKTQKPMIVIDAGHGGKDPGSIGVRGTYEKNITLSVALKLKQALLNTGRYRVKLTREKDVYLTLKERPLIASNVNAHLFISLHADKSENISTKGISVYTLSDKASDSLSAQLEKSENKEFLTGGTIVNDEIFNILKDYRSRDTKVSSEKLARRIVTSSDKNPKVNVINNPMRFANFAVLRGIDIPSVLVELGFLSNRQDEKKLVSPSYQQLLAGVVVKAVDDYFSGKGFL